MACSVLVQQWQWWLCGRLEHVFKYRQSVQETVAPFHVGVTETMTGKPGNWSQRLVNWARIKSPWITIFNSGGCNACDIEILACLIPRFDVERFGILAKGSPRHADILLVTGPATLKQASRLRRVWEQMPEPKYVIAIGACGAGGGVFHGLYHVMDSVDSVIPVDVYVAGCPPRPDELINAVVTCLGLLAEDIAHGGKEWRQRKAPASPDAVSPGGEVPV